MKRSMEEHLSMYFHVYTVTLLIDESILSYSKVAGQHICFFDQGFNCFMVLT